MRAVVPPEAARGAAEEPEDAGWEDAGGRSFLGLGRRRFQEGGSVLVKDKCPYDEGWTLLASGKKGHLRRSEGQSSGVGAEKVGLGSGGR